LSAAEEVCTWSSEHTWLAYSWKSELWLIQIDADFGNSQHGLHYSRGTAEDQRDTDISAVDYFVRGARQHVLGFVLIPDAYFRDSGGTPCRGIVVPYSLLFAIAVVMAVTSWLVTARRRRRRIPRQ
jgi:hypothetical protein